MIIQGINLNKEVKNFNFVHTVENLNPHSVQYLNYWKELKRRIIEGYWFEGKWMPGPLYFYINFCKIQLLKKETDVNKSLNRPNLRDVEWEKAYVYTEAKGFSGFSDDKLVTCNRWVQEIEQLKDLTLRKDKIQSYLKIGFLSDTEIVSIKGDEITLKKFEDPRLYLRKIHNTNLGKPLFTNNAKNIIDIESRRLGKSYFAAGGFILHNFLTDGAVNYDMYLEGLNNKSPLASETLVGASDAKYTNDLLSKVKLAMDNLEGSQTFGGVKFNCPLSKSFIGSLAPGKFIEASSLIKVGNSWESRGSKSKIHNRTFSNNALAGNGTGPNLVVFEEVGFMPNVIDAMSALKDATYAGLKKFGVILCTGTGGDMEAGKSEQAKEIFYNPHSYDCLAFEDIWEEYKDIGYFVPYHYTLDGFRDTEGRVNLDMANVWIKEKRKKLEEGRSVTALAKERQNNPITHSEAFLITEGNKFPTSQIKTHLDWLKSQSNGAYKGQNGELVYSNAVGKIEVEWVPDLGNRLRPCHYNMTEKEDTTGCITIFEHPIKVEGEIPPFLYIAGTDPYDQDQAPSSVSLGSTFIYKTFLPGVEGVYETIVAEYTARPTTAKQHHENVRKLLYYYNAKTLYENERNSLKMHFEHNHCLHLLARQPTALKALETTTVNRTYGIHMTNIIKSELEGLSANWLIEDAEEGKINLHKIYSIPLLEELLNYNDIGNFDRVIAFILVILHRKQNHEIKVKSIKRSTFIEDPFMKRAFNKKFY